MELPDQIVRRKFRQSIRPEWCPCTLLHLRNSADWRSDKDELRFTRRSLLEKWSGSLEEEEDRVAVNLHVLLDSI